MVLAVAAYSPEVLVVVSSAGPALRCTFLALGRQVWLQTPGRAPVSAALHASLASKQPRRKAFGLFAFRIVLIDPHITILGCAVDMHKSECMLSLAWGMFFFFGFRALFFFFPSVCKAECDPKLRIDLSVIRPKDV